MVASYKHDSDITITSLLTYKVMCSCTSLFTYTDLFIVKTLSKYDVWHEVLVLDLLIFFYK